MVQPAFLSMALAALLVGLILSSGCAGQKEESQPPASTYTISTPKPATPIPETSTPVIPGTTPIPYTTGVTPTFTPATVAQAGAAILIKGEVLGLKSATVNFIEEIQFTVVKAPRAEPVTFEVPNTQIIFTKGGQQFGVNYLILSGDVNGNRILEDGETFEVSIPFTSESPQYEIYAGQKFTMAIKNPPQPQVTVTTEAPPVLEDSNILARAP
ncbi:MAG: hypothetical protein LUQ60_06975 [Methanomicrobiales archaeon]|nr:hypothetical protein [Methanomicrobiales archaeon]